MAINVAQNVIRIDNDEDDDENFEFINPHYCEFCQRNYSSRNSLMKHKSIYHNDKKKLKNKGNFKFKCDQCDDSFRTERDLIGHKYKHTGILCDICGKSYSQLAAMKRHRLSHSGIKAHKCDECPKAFYSMVALKSHQLGHTLPAVCEPQENGDENFYFCVICQRSYSSASSLAKHKYIFHTIKKTANRENFKFKCEECGENFRSERDLQGHKYRHTGIVCDFCGKSFTQLTTLNRHRLYHTGTASHKCQECPKSFYTPESLKAHMLGHTLPCVCDICGQRFRDSKVLRIHLRKHTGEMPEKCKVCNQSFISITKLRLHEIVHSDERPFECEICGYRFKRRRNLNSHMNTHSTERNHVCKTCGKAFITSSYLNTHLLTHNKDKKKRKAKAKKADEEQPWVISDDSSLIIEEEIYLDEDTMLEDQ
uniref:C2H2-type domain-containing protein n=1 Tax=Stomoxys calcitrans TaxID=35570 RepID=A0A1I8NY38_STOCA